MDFPCTQRLPSTDNDDSLNSSYKTKQPVAVLVIKKQNGIKETEHAIYTGENTIGREAGDILIPEGLALSREHACIEAKQGSTFLFDCGSSNGTKIGALKIKPNIRYQLQNNSIITFANIECIYREVFGMLFFVHIVETKCLILVVGFQRNTLKTVEDNLSTPKTSTFSNVLAEDTPDFALRNNKLEENILKEIPETPCQDESLLSNLSPSDNQILTSNEIRNPQYDEAILQPRKLELVSDSDATDLDDEPEVSDNEIGISGKPPSSKISISSDRMFSQSAAELSDVEDGDNSHPVHNEPPKSGLEAPELNLDNDASSPPQVERKKLDAVNLPSQERFQDLGGIPPVQNLSPSRDVCFEEEDESDVSGDCEISDEEPLVMSLGRDVEEQISEKKVGDDEAKTMEKDSSNVKTSDREERVNTNENVAMLGKTEKTTSSDLNQSVKQSDSSTLIEQSCSVGNPGNSKATELLTPGRKLELPCDYSSDDDDYDEMAYQNCSIFVDSNSDSDITDNSLNNSISNSNNNANNIEYTKSADGNIPDRILADETLQSECNNVSCEHVESVVAFVPESQAMDTDESCLETSYSTEHKDDSVFTGSNDNVIQHVVAEIKSVSQLDCTVDKGNKNEDVTIEDGNQGNKDEDVTIEDCNQGNKDEDVTIEDGNKDEDVTIEDGNKDEDVTIEDGNQGNKDEDVTIEDGNQGNKGEDVTIEDGNQGNKDEDGNQGNKDEKSVDQAERKRILKSLPTLEDSMVISDLSYHSEEPTEIDEDVSLPISEYELRETQSYCSQESVEASTPPKKTTKKRRSKRGRNSRRKSKMAVIEDVNPSQPTSSKRYSKGCVRSPECAASSSNANNVNLIEWYNEVTHKEKDVIPIDHLNKSDDQNKEDLEMENNQKPSSQAADATKNVIEEEIIISNIKEIQPSHVLSKEASCSYENTEKENEKMKVLEIPAADKNNNNNPEGKRTAITKPIHGKENIFFPKNGDDGEFSTVFGDSEDPSEVFDGFENNGNKTITPSQDRVTLQDENDESNTVSDQPSTSNLRTLKSEKSQKSFKNTPNLRQRNRSNVKTKEARESMPKKEEPKVVTRSKLSKSGDKEVKNENELNKKIVPTRQSLRSLKLKTERNKRKLFDDELAVLEVETFSPIESKRNRRAPRSSSRGANAKKAPQPKKKIVVKNELLTPQKEKEIENNFTHKTGISIKGVKIEIDHCESPLAVGKSRGRNSLNKKQVPVTKVESTDRKMLLRKRKISSRENGTPRKKVKSESSSRVVYTSRERKSKPKVMFTGFLDPEAEKTIVKLGGELTTDLRQCTHLIAKEICRTLKFFCAMVRGSHILTPDWVYQSKLSHSFLPEEHFQLSENWKHLTSPKSRKKPLLSPTLPSDIEKQYNFSLKRSLLQARSQGHLLFHGLSIHVTSSVKPSPRDLYDIISCGDGKPVKKLPKKRNALLPSDLIIVSCIEDKKACASAIKAGVRIVTNEFILTGILQQKLSYGLSLHAEGQSSVEAHAV